MFDGTLTGTIVGEPEVSSTSRGMWVRREVMVHSNNRTQKVRVSARADFRGRELYTVQPGAYVAIGGGISLYSRENNDVGVLELRLQSLEIADGGAAEKAAANLTLESLALAAGVDQNAGTAPAVAPPPPPGVDVDTGEIKDGD